MNILFHKLYISLPHLHRTKWCTFDLISDVFFLLSVKLVQYIPVKAYFIVRCRVEEKKETQTNLKWNGENSPNMFNFSNQWHGVGGVIFFFYQGTENFKKNKKQNWVRFFRKPAETAQNYSVARTTRFLHLSKIFQAYNHW